MKYCIAVFFYLLMMDDGYSQESLYSAADAIEINYTDKYGVHFLHKVEKGHTLYGLSRTFNVPVARIKLFNEMTADQAIQPSQVLRIPFDDQLLYKGTSIAEFPNGTFLPVYYTIKPSETLYRVSKVYFDQGADIILQRNGLTSSQLQIGQQLLMGWVPIDVTITVIEDQKKELARTPIVPVIVNPKIVVDSLQRDSIQFVDPVIDSLEEAVIEIVEPSMEDTGLAYWNRNSSDKDNLFVMHPTARINSLIEIYNPQSNRRTFAKVIARIPQGAYPANIDIILSPRVAHTLRAINSEFRVRMKYFE